MCVCCVAVGRKIRPVSVGDVPFQNVHAFCSMNMFLCVDFHQPMFIAAEVLPSTSLPVSRTFLQTCLPLRLQLFRIICSRLVECSGNPYCASCIWVTLCWWHNGDTLWEWISKTRLLKVKPKHVFPGHIEDISILYDQCPMLLTNIFIMYDMNCWMILELDLSVVLVGNCQVHCHCS